MMAPEHRLSIKARSRLISLSWRLWWALLHNYSPCLLLLPKRTRSATIVKDGVGGKGVTMHKEFAKPTRERMAARGDKTV